MVPDEVSVGGRLNCLMSDLYFGEQFDDEYIVPFKTSYRGVDGVWGWQLFVYP